MEAKCFPFLLALVLSVCHTCMTQTVILPPCQVRRITPLIAPQYNYVFDIFAFTCTKLSHHKNDHIFVMEITVKASSIFFISVILKVVTICVFGHTVVCFTLLPFYVNDDQGESTSHNITNATCPKESKWDSDSGNCLPTICYFSPEQITGPRRLAIAAMAAYHVNQHNRSIILQGSRIVEDFGVNMVYIDSAGDYLTAATSWASLPTKCAAAVGEYYSSVSGPLSKLLYTANVPLLSYASSSDSLSNYYVYPSFSRVVYTDSHLGAAVLNLCQHFDWLSLGILYVDDEYGTNFKNSVTDHANAHGFRTRAIAHFYSTDRTSLTSAMNTLKSSGVRVIIAIVFLEELEIIFDSAGAAGLLEPNITWVLPSGIGLDQKHFDKLDPNILQGMLFASWSGFADPRVSANMTRAYHSLMAQGNRSSFWSYLPASVQSALTPQVESQADLAAELGYIYDSLWMVSLALSRSNISLMGTLQWADHLQSLIIDQTIDGVSGPVRLENNGDRHVGDDAMMTVFNIRPGNRPVPVGQVSAIIDQPVDIHHEILWRSGLVTPVDSRENIPMDGYTCPSGSFFDSVSNQCTPCLPGEFLDSSLHSPACVPCPAGSYSPNHGASYCMQCTQGWYQPLEGQVTCQFCPRYSISWTLGADSVSQCFCREGYYLKEMNSTFLRCDLCPAGAECLGDKIDDVTGDRITRFPYALQGYWHGDHAVFDEFIECKRRSAACQGGMYEEDGKTYFQSRCHTNFQGRQCNECKSGYHSDGKDCVKCYEGPFSGLFYALMAPLILIGFFSVLTYLTKTFPSLVYSYMACQVIALVGAFNLQWGDSSDPHVRFFSILSTVNFNIDLAYLDCSLRFGFYERWWVVSVLPLIHIFTVLTISAAFNVYHRARRVMNSNRRNQRKSGGDTPTALDAAGRDNHDSIKLNLHIPSDSSSVYLGPKPGDENKATAEIDTIALEMYIAEIESPPIRSSPLRYIFDIGSLHDLIVQSTPAFLIMLKYAYIPVLSNNLKGLLCKEFGGFTFLVHAPEIECWSSTHIPMFVASLFWLVIFNVGLPVILCFILVRGKRRKLLSDPAFQRQFGMLYVAYEPDYYWFGMLNFFHMGFMAVFSVCAGSQPIVQILGAIVVICIRLGLQLYTGPYLVGSRDLHTTLCHLLTLAVIIIGTVFYIRDCENYDADTRNPHGKCFSVSIAQNLLWVVFAIGVLIIFSGMKWDRFFIRNKRQLNKIPKHRGEEMKLTFLDLMRNPAIYKWLSEADDDVKDCLRDMESSLNRWCDKQGLCTPMNQFLLEDRALAAPIFFSSILDNHKLFFDFGANCSLEERQKFLELVKNFHWYETVSNLSGPMHMSRLIDRNMLPFVTKWLFSVDEGMRKKVVKVQQSWHNFKSPLGGREDAIKRRAYTNRMLNKMVEESDFVQNML